jgi:hypothetical protein
MALHFRDTPLIAMVAAGLVAGCADDPTEARAPEPVAVPIPASPAYSTDQYESVLAAVTDVSQRVVAGIADETSARAVQAAMALVAEDLATNNPIRIRLAIDHAMATLEQVEITASALEFAAELDAVKLVLSNAAQLLPIQLPK